MLCLIVATVYKKLFWPFQSFTVNLSDVTGSARLISDASSGIVTIRANDNPNGFVELASPTFIATEEDIDATALVTIVRR